MLTCLEYLVKNEHMKPPAYLVRVKNHACDIILLCTVPSNKIDTWVLPTIYTSFSKQTQNKNMDVHICCEQPSGGSFTMIDPSGSKYFRYVTPGRNRALNASS